MSDRTDSIFYSRTVLTDVLGVWLSVQYMLSFRFPLCPLAPFEDGVWSSYARCQQRTGPQTRVVTLRSLQASALGWHIGRLHGLKNDCVYTSHLELPAGELLETGPGVLTMFMKCSHMQTLTIPRCVPVHCLSLNLCVPVSRLVGRSGAVQAGQAHVLRLISPVCPSANSVFAFPLQEDMVQTSIGRSSWDLSNVEGSSP